MLTFVSANWVEERLDSAEFLIADPRSAIRYMSGHAKNGVNLPVAKARDAQGRILRPEDLARWIGTAGLNDRRAPVLYDNMDGRNAALLAWILMYLGRRDVHLMETSWEKWVADGREVFYRPVKASPANFTVRVRPELRRTISQVQENVAGKTKEQLIDFRSGDEFSGAVDHDNRPGHIPGALNLVWQELAGTNGDLLAPPERLEELTAAAGVNSGRSVVAYCRTGLRAALGFVALARLGREVALYDGSYAEWAQSGSVVESAEAAEEQSRAAESRGT
jgi:thiosulfate/3-mercaptopyruvate sulfurtransferase